MTTQLRPDTRTSPAQLPTRPRRLGQWTAATLFVIGSALCAAWLWSHQGDRQEVLVVSAAVPAGQVIERDHLSTAAVSGVPDAIPLAKLDSVLGTTTAVGLVRGQVLTEAMLTAQPVPGPGQRVVGLRLEDTRMPGGLRPGASVTLLAVPPTGDTSQPDLLDNPKVLTPSADVVEVATVEGGGTRISLLVAEDDASRVAAYAAAGRVALVQTPLGSRP